MIKKLLLIVFLLPGSLHAISLLDSAKTWNVLQCAYGWGTYCSTVKYRIIGDSIVNIVPYKKLYLTHDSINPNWYFHALIREDTLTKKVYFAYPGSQEELLYDFSLNKGDTAFVMGACLFPVVDSVDTFNYNGVYRRRILFDWWAGEAANIWVEGIGNTIGLLDNFILTCMADVGAHLLCVDSATTQIYHTTYFTDCFLILKTNEIADPDKLISFSPNPFKENITINCKSPNGENVILQLIDQTGRIVFEENFIIDSKNLSVTLPKLSSGCYSAIIRGDKILSKSKLLKIR